MKTIKNKTIVVGMSGGVDSSVAAALLKRQGYDVVGVYMKNWSRNFGDYGCTWAEDAEDARKVAAKIGIPFYVWNFEKEYYSKVVEYFLAEYKAGRTPNPDVMCNKEIKFKVFLERAMKLGADFVATGHYARTSIDKRGTAHLLKGADSNKDQSYFLYALTQSQLKKTVFPIGDYVKPEIRKLAKRLGLPNHAKKDSQGICFIGQIDVTEFLKAHIKSDAGSVVDPSGKTIGRHYGLPFYTIGQREGLGVGGTGPYYVIGKKPRLNQLVVTNDAKDPGLWRKSFTVTEVNWTTARPKFPLKTGVAIRYRHPDQPALLEKADSGSIKVTFEAPQRAITPGQAAVFYAGVECLGGGVITKVV